MDVSRFTGHLERMRRQAQVRQLVLLAEHLDEPNRLLVEHVYHHGRPITELARAARRPPRTLQRRLARLIQRMNSPEYRFLATASHRLDPLTRHVARRVVCRGRTYRRTAAELRVSLHTVRRRLDRFRRCLADTHAAADRPLFNNS